MRNLITLIVVALASILAFASATGADPLGLATEPAPAGAAGGPVLSLARGDFIGVRNIQGGVHGDTNLDIGAGSTEEPGAISLNYDVGRNTTVYAGQKIPRFSVTRDAVTILDSQGRPMMRFGPGRHIKCYVKDCQETHSRR